MIKSNKPLSIPEALEYVVKADKENTDVIGFMKKFAKLKKKEAEELKKKLLGLDLLKLREEHVIKIIDLIPENVDELNKIFIDVSLDEDETKKILETIKEFK